MAMENVVMMMDQCIWAIGSTTRKMDIVVILIGKVRNIWAISAKVLNRAKGT